MHVRGPYLNRPYLHRAFPLKGPIWISPIHVGRSLLEGPYLNRLYGYRDVSLNGPISIPGPTGPIQIGSYL
jgi:hypothetical protein